MHLVASTLQDSND